MTWGKAAALMRLRLFLLLVAAASIAAGCASDADDKNPADDGAGNDNSTDDGQGIMAPQPVRLEVAAVGTYPANPAFDPARLEALAGQDVTLVFSNDDPVSQHDWVLEGVDGAATERVASSGEVSIEFVAPEPGEYTYYCSLPGHRDAGMVGTFVVGTP